MKDSVVVVDEHRKLRHKYNIRVAFELETVRWRGQAPAGMAAREILLKPEGTLRDQIAKAVDFSKEIVLVFRWSGANDDKLSFRVGQTKGPTVIFELRQGDQKGNKSHFRLFAVTKNSTWIIPTRDGFPEPHKIETVLELAKEFPDKK